MESSRYLDLVRGMELWNGIVKWETKHASSRITLHMG